MQQPHKRPRGVKVVVTDGSRAYKASAEACLPGARHVLDRFHVTRWFAAALTAARRDIQRRQPHGATPAFDPDVFGARYLLTRRGDQLTEADRTRLDALFGAHPRLKTGRQALQELHGLYTASDRDGAPAALGRFYRPPRGRRAAQVPRHRRHHHRPVPRDLGLAPQRPGLQRPHRRHQQPAPSTAPHRPRLHQPRQPPSQRPADNMTRPPVPATPHPTFRRRAQKLNWPTDSDEVAARAGTRYVTRSRSTVA